MSSANKPSPYFGGRTRAEELQKMRDLEAKVVVLVKRKRGR